MSFDVYSHDLSSEELPLNLNKILSGHSVAEDLYLLDLQSKVQRRRIHTMCSLFLFVAAHTLCIALCIASIIGHPLQMAETEEFRSLPFFIALTHSLSLHSLTLIDPNRHRHARLIHAAVLSYCYGFVVSFVCVPSLVLIVMKDLKVPELIPLILAVLLVIDYILFVLSIFLSALGLHQALHHIEGSETDTAFSRLPTVWKAAFITSWVTSVVVIVSSCAASCKFRLFQKLESSFFM